MSADAIWTVASAIIWLVAFAAAGSRWLRIAQREHYLAGSVTRFMYRWWVSRAVNIVALLVAAAALATPLGFIAGLVALGTPVGLSVRGRTSALAWTARLRRVAAAFGAVVVVLLLVMPGLAWALLIAGPALLDLVLLALGPVEDRLGDRWVEKASQSLSRSGARVVAITGSYGKTSTKGYLKAMLEGLTSVVASPASFNNRMGLARAVNEHLTPGTDVFIAEMGTYGKGEIGDLCEWIPPTVSVMTAIGPVHLERMKSEEAIASAKREILAGDAIAVINVDHPLLAAIADDERAGREVITCSTTDPAADIVASAEGDLVVRGRTVGRFDPDRVHRGNVACAMGGVLALGFDPQAATRALADLPVSPHRMMISTSESGVVVIDDTFNANPAGARAALEALDKHAKAGRRVVVTPGMVELGGRQREENAAFSRLVTDGGSQLVAVGRTNRRALLEGGGSSVIVVDKLPEAVDWVRQNLGPGDAVLYENDLPDHYP